LPFKEITNPPTHVSLSGATGEKKVILRWEYPTEPAECSLYFVISGTVDGASIQQIVSGQSREHQLDVVDSNSASLQIGAANKLGTGPLSEPTTLQQQQSAVRTGRLGVYVE
jgi:hypothetical protein